MKFKYKTLECDCRYIIIKSISKTDIDIIKEQEWYCKECKKKLFISEIEMGWIMRYGRLKEVCLSAYYGGRLEKFSLKNLGRKRRIKRGMKKDV